MTDSREQFQARDPFAAGTFPLCAATHDLGIRRLFDLSTLIMLLDCRPGDRVLDLGAGPGFSSEMLARLGYEVIAVDPDHEGLTNNRRRQTFDPTRIEGQIRVVQGDAEHLPLSSGSFDGALGMNVLHHLGQLEPAVIELERVLKPGARAVFCEPGLDHLDASETQRAIAEHGENDRPFDVMALLETALTNGFAEAMLTATLQPPLRLLPVQEVPLYLSGNHPRVQLTPAGVVDELHRRHAYAMLVKAGTRPKTSRHPGQLRCHLQVTGAPAVAKAGERLTLEVEALNTGDTAWLARPSRFGGFVTVGCKLTRADGLLISDGLGRTFLQCDVAPGERVSTTLSIELPSSLSPGPHLLGIDLIDELICWFADLDPSAKSVHNLLIGPG